MSNTFNNRIILGNAHTSVEIHLRNTSIMTDANREAIIECIRAFCDLRFSDAFHKLVIMTCHCHEDFPANLWEQIHLAPNLIPDENWKAFVDELMYQYKLIHPGFMADITVPTVCSETYSALADSTSELAAYLFFKRANDFLKLHSHNSIGQEQIGFVSNLLNWHSKDEELNKKKQLHGFNRLSIRHREAVYFHSHLEAIKALFSDMVNYELELHKPVIPSELPFILENLDEGNMTTALSDKPVTQTKELQPQPSAEPSVKELNLKNILEHEDTFRSAIIMNSAQHLLELHMAGFEIGQINAKRAIIAEILEHHAQMVKASEALTK